MKKQLVQDKIETSFKELVQTDNKVKNAYLVVHSERLGIDLKCAEGFTENTPADIGQPNHMASVGKLFTATLISMLYEKGKLDFEDRIIEYLESDLMKGLHVYKGKDYSADITIRHLLMQTSGLYDVFFHLWEKMVKDPDFRITPREAVLWGKENLKPVAAPGKRHKYTDTNYYLLGLIIERVTGKPFHEVMHELVFDPVGMPHAFMHGYSKPKIESDLPAAKLYIENHDLLSIKGVHQIDYAGGSVVAPLPEYLTFLKALVNHRIVKKETLDRMLEDDAKMGFPYLGFNYGYSIWKLRSIPVIIPAQYKCWGCVGVTGAFLFYHPTTESCLIGTFNDFAYRSKALQFMVKKIIKELLRGENPGVKH
jgi:D-alanyl-D-alanine carboxypeptidase